MAYDCKILLDSLAPSGARLTTFEITFPRFVLAEFNTHRLLSRNSASSRAIPVEKRVAAVESDPFVPETFGQNQKGMQANEELGDEAAAASKSAWLSAAHAAVQHAKYLAKIGVHKQLANRLLEPFLWHTAVVSATEWDNFFAQRCHPAAQPEIRRIAEMMRDAREASTPRKLLAGEWHLPYADDYTSSYPPLSRETEPGFGFDWRQVSVARCARVSYLTQDGRRDPQEDLALFERLRTAEPMHASPFEHVAMALERREHSGNFVGWMQYRKLFTCEHAGPPRADLKALSPNELASESR